MRDPICEFHGRTDRLSDRERRDQLRVLDELPIRIPRRSATEVEGEIADVRTARRGGGRLTPVGK